MGSFSISFTLGKASALHGANVGHNNREFFAGNVDPLRTDDNITYVKQDVEEAYDELFGDALAEYNAKQKQPCRRIENYYEHLLKSKREEPFYELVVQIGDSKNAPVGSENGELAKKMLGEYMESFQKDNPNLKVFNAVLHLDEASPHLHINFIPYTTEPTKNGLSTRVSMKQALNEQGFTAKNRKDNRLVHWEERERGAIEKILHRHNHTREDKNARYKHQTVEEYKFTQDREKLLPKMQAAFIASKNPSQEETRKLLYENQALRGDNAKLKEEKVSPWKSFYYSSPEKQAYVQSELERLGIAFLETDVGFEAQDCYVEQIRKIEKSFVPAANPYREKLRGDLDKFIMQSNSFEDVLEKLRKSGYQIREGKYIAVIPKHGQKPIRLKSLGADYSEMAIKNRLTDKRNFEQNISKKAGEGNPDTISTQIHRTKIHYTQVFARNALPVRKKNPAKYFSWENDAELDKLSALNKRLSAGATLESIQRGLALLETSVSEKEEKLSGAKADLKFYEDLLAKAELCYEKKGSASPAVVEAALAELQKRNIQANTYRRLDKLIEEARSEIDGLEKELSPEREKLKEAADVFAAVEKITGKTYVQELVIKENQRRASEYAPNGYFESNKR